MADNKKSLLNVKVQDVGDAHIVLVNGECDMSSAPILKDVLHSLISPGEDQPARLIVDLRGLRYMDSSAFWVLAAANRKVSEVGGSVSLVATAGQPILRVIKLLKMDRLMKVHATPEDALAEPVIAGESTKPPKPQLRPPRSPLSNSL